MTSAILQMRRGRYVAGLVAVALSALLAPVAAGDEPPTAFRRILVPADRPTVWPREGEKFLPVEAEEFDALLAEANKPPSDAFLAEAEYEARVLGSTIVGGRGRWRVVLYGERPSRMSIGDISIVMQDVKWLGGRDSSAKLGWNSSEEGAATSFGMLVPQSGELEFSWRPSTHRSSAGTREIPLQLPAAASTRLTLDVPAGKRPVIDGSVVLKSPTDFGEAGEWVLVVNDAASVLRIETTNGVLTDAPPPTSLHKDLRYDVTDRGIDVTATLRLEGSGPPLKELKVSLPAGVQLIAAATGDQELSWRIATKDESIGSASALIDLPDSSPGGPQEIVLRAWAPLAIESPQQLPRLSTQGTFWTSGRIELAIDESLELCEFVPVDCAPSVPRTGASSRDTAQRLAFDCYSPQGTIELTVRQRGATGRVRMGTTLDVGNPGIDGRLVTEVYVDRGSLHALSAELQAGWSINAVETSPADALGEWYVRDQQTSRTLELQLRRAATPERPITIIVTGRNHRAAPLEPIVLNQLGVLHWESVAVERELIQLRAVDPYQLEPVGESRLFAADKLPAEDHRLLAASSNERVYDARVSASDAAVRLTSLQGTYDAEIQIDVALVGEQLHQKCRIDCRPHGRGIDHVLVHVSEAASAPLRWVNADTQEPLVAERMPKSDPRLGGLPPDGELWLLQLRRLYAQPVAIAATLSTPWPERRRVPLLSLPDADSQRGRVTVLSEGVALPAIVARRMTPTPLPGRFSDDSAHHASGNVQALYRYQPARFYDAESTSELWLGPPKADGELGSLIARQVAIQSRFAADGSGAHRIRYVLENQGAVRATLSLPRGFRLESARLDGQPVGRLTTGATGELTVLLPARRRNLVLELDVLGKHRPLDINRRLPSPLAASEITILGGTWKIWLPREFSLTNEFSVGGDVFDWRQRLFGPLARPRPERGFNPFNAADWNTQWASLNLSGTKPALAAGRVAEISESMPTGWSVFEVGFVSEPPSTLEIRLPHATAAWSLSVFLVCLLGAILGRLRTILLVPLVAVAAACALWLPTAFAPLATAAVLALLLCGLSRWMQLVFSHGKLAALMLLALLAASPTQADAAPSTASIHRVLVPVDESGKPSGTKYFVSEQFLRQLLETSHKRPAGSTWFITSMRCRGEFVKLPDPSGPEVGTWSVSFEIEVLSRDTSIELPLVEREANWSSTASLDGIPAAITWNELGDRCSLRIAEPGRYQLSIPFEPRVQVAEERQQVDLTLPPIQDAEVRWVSPLPLNDLTTSGTTLARTDESTRTIWHGVLDGSGRLSASWVDTVAGPPAGASRRVVEMMWLRFKPNAVELDARYVLQDGIEWPATMDFLVDSRWELVNGHQDTSPQEVQTLPNGRQLMRLRPPRSTGEKQDLMLTFRLRGTSPLGRHRLPEIGFESMPVSQRLLAVSCDPALVCEPSSVARSVGGAVAGFAAAWGELREAESPQLAYDRSKLDAGWHLAVRPGTIVSTFRERLALVADSDQLRLAYQSHLRPYGADQFRWSLTVPAKLVVDNIAVDRGGEDVPIDWVRATPNRVNVFFADRLTEPVRLQLVGSLPVNRFGRMPLPRITAAERPLAVQNVSLYRSSEVLAAWQFPAEPPWIEGGATDSPPFDKAAHFVRAYAIDPTTADGARIVVESNEPAVTADTLTALAHESGKWSATYTIHLHVDRGELEKLRLRVPKAWGGPYTVTPTASTEIIAPAAEDQDSTLEIRLPQSVRAGESVRLQVRSPLEVGEGQPATAPRVVPLSVNTVRSYLSLPIRIDAEPTAWTRIGVETSKLPSELVSEAFDATAADDVETLRIVADKMNVTLQPRTVRGSTASVRLAETTVHVDRAGERFAVTRFIIAPQGLSACTVKLPQNDRLVRVMLDGRPAMVRPVDPRAWQMQLGPPNLPQILEIVTRTVERSGERTQVVELSRPVLMRSGQPIPVEINLWTLHSEEPGEWLRANDASVLSPGALSALRLERLVGISQSATRPLIESPLVDAYNWFTNWAAQLQAAQTAAQAYQSSIGSAASTTQVTQLEDAPLTEVVARADAWLQRMEEFFIEPSPVAGSQASAAGNAFDTAHFAESSLGERFCFISDGSRDGLRVEFVPPGLTSGQLRVAVLISIVVLAAAAFWLIRIPTTIESVQRWPEVVGLLLGLAAWAWLRPSVLGFGIAVVSAGLLVHRLYQERKSPRHDSSNQSSSIPKDSA